MRANNSMSNGGGFIGTLACDPKGSDLFTGLAAHSGSFYTDIHGPNNGCAPSKIVPLLEIHGGADKVVPYAGGQGEGGKLPAIPHWLNWWAHRNKCTGKTVQYMFGGEVCHESWSCGGKAGLLQHYKVKSLGKWTLLLLFSFHPFLIAVVGFLYFWLVSNGLMKRVNQDMRGRTPNPITRKRLYHKDRRLSKRVGSSWISSTLCYRDELVQARKSAQRRNHAV
jgi:hypothetical protein